MSRDVAGAPNHRMTTPHVNTAADQDVPFGRRASLLSGVRVLDLTRFLAGPFAGMVLADLGAEVIKVEQLTGDSTRTQPPYQFGGDSAYFIAINRNKKSISLDLRSADGRAALDRLIATADVIVDNLRAPQRESLRLTYPHIAKVNPRIISCSVTGFGSDGPYEDRPAYDIIVEALAGVMSLTGPEGGPSVRAGVPIGDIAAGLYAAIAILGGLEFRRRNGHGQHIDVAMLDSQVSLLSYLAEYYFVGGLIATHQGRAHVSIPTYNTFLTQDGTEIVIAANTQEMWVSLCEVLGRTELPQDPRFLTPKDRLAHRAELVPILEEEFKLRDREEIYGQLLAHKVPVAPINRIDVALKDPQVRHRHMVVRAPHRSGQDYLTLGNPVQSDEPAGEPFSSPPALGGDSRAILHELGYAPAEVEALIEKGALKATPAQDGGSVPASVGGPAGAPVAADGHAQEKHGRLPWFRPEDLNEAQRAYYDTLTSGPRKKSHLLDEQGRLQGAFNARLLDPVVGTAIQNLGAKLRFETTALTGRIRELTILEVAASDRSDFEWEAHREAGLEAGLTEDEIGAIRSAAPIPSLSPEEATARRVVRSLLTAGDLDDALFAEAEQRLGPVAIFDIVSLVGHYRHTALALRVWRVPLAGGAAPVFGGR